MKSFVAMSLAAAALCLAPPALATHVSCGQRITTDTVLDSDLDCPAGNGIEIAASGVDLDLAGHTVRGETGFFHSSLGIWVDGGTQRYSGITVTNGHVVGFGTSIHVYGAGNSAVTDMQVDGKLAVGGQPTNNVIQDNVVMGDPNQFPRGGIELTESLWFGDETFRPAGNKVLSNTTTSLVLDMSDRNEVRGNHIVGGPLSVVGFAKSPDFFEGNGADENVIAGNRIESDRTFPGYAILLAQACRRNVVEGNEITGAQPRGILVSVGCADNQIRSNSITGATGVGIQLGDPPYRTSGNVVEGNSVRDAAQDGIRATGSADHSVVRSNAMSGSGDDGIDVEDASATVTSNFAHDNGDWGIIAVPTVADGGGNRAWSNGQPAQCLNVSCTPFPPSQRCRIKGKGTITAGNGDEATFDVQVHTVGHARPAGRLTYRDRGPTDRLTARSARIDAVTCTANTASVFGTARVTGSREPVRFRVDLEESPETFRIRLDDVYDSGIAPVSGGNIRIQ